MDDHETSIHIQMRLSIPTKNNVITHGCLIKIDFKYKRNIFIYQPIISIYMLSLTLLNYFDAQKDIKAN